MAMKDEYEIVWLEDERTFAELVHMGAYFSWVRYSRGNEDYEILVANDEYKYIEGDDIGDTQD